MKSLRAMPSRYAILRRQSLSMLGSIAFVSLCLSAIPQSQASIGDGLSATQLPTDLNAKVYQSPILRPGKLHEKQYQIIHGEIEKNHYDQNRVRALKTSDVFDGYIDYLDPASRVFMAEDIQYLQHWYEKQTDWDSSNNSIEKVFEIYNLWLTRLQEIYRYQIGLLEADSLNVHREEWLEVTADEAEPLTSRKDWLDYWRRQLKSSYVARILEHGGEERARDFQLLRLRSRLRYISQRTGEDVFSAFVNSNTSLLDPHSSYLTPDDARAYRQALTTQLEGIGAVLSERDDYVEVVRLIPGGPAQKSGQIFPGDRILAVTEEGAFQDVIGFRLTEVVEMIKGPRGTDVGLELKSGGLYGGPVRRIELTREIIDLEDQRARSRVLELNHQGRDVRIGLIELSNFYGSYISNETGEVSAAASQDVRKAIDALAQEGVSGIVLDLRNNGGGYLSEAINVASLFLNGNRVVLVRERNGRIRSHGTRSLDPPIWQGPLAVLVNRLSASASEIVAAAIQDYGRGLVIGTRTFGKGSVQEGWSLGEDIGDLSVTKMMYFRVDGESTQFNGVYPDVLLPSVWNPELVGESSYDNTLIPHTVNVSKPFAADLSANLGKLQESHAARREALPELRYLTERFKQSQIVSERDFLPLDLHAYQLMLDSDRQLALDTRNELRVALGEEPFSDWDSLEKSERARSADPEAPSIEDKALWDEAGRILAEMASPPALQALVTVPES